MLTFVPGSREGIVKFNVVLSVVSNISETAFIDGVCDLMLCPFGLTGVDQVISTDVNLGVRVNYTRSCEMIMCIFLVSIRLNSLLSLTGVMRVKGCSENDPVPMLSTAATEEEYFVKGINFSTVEDKSVMVCESSQHIVSCSQ